MAESKSEQSATGGAVMVNIIPEAPLSLVAVDIFGPVPTGRGGVNYLFVELDTFPKVVRSKEGYS